MSSPTAKRGGHDISTLVTLERLQGTRYAKKIRLDSLSEWARPLGEAILNQNREGLEESQKNDLLSIQRLAGTE